MLRRIEMRTLVFMLTLLCSSCIPQQAIRQAEQNVILNRAHAADGSLPEEARQVATDNADAWEAQLYLLDSDKAPSQDARTRATF